MLDGGLGFEKMIEYKLIDSWIIKSRSNTMKIIIYVFGYVPIWRYVIWNAIVTAA